MSGERKIVVGNKPVNRRTTRGGKGPAPIAPVAKARVRITQTRNLLGAPLLEQLRPAGRHRAAPTRIAIGGGVAAAGGGVALFLAWLQTSPVLAAVGTLAVAGGLFLARPRAQALGMPELPTSPLISLESLQALDAALGAVAPELPSTLVAPLAELKQVVVRLARHPAAGTVDEHFRVEDRLYVNECVRRYLPDSLQGLLAVPRDQRDVPLADGGTPHGLLLSQLALLRKELEDREGRLTSSAAEALQRQQRFLKSKAGN